LRVGVIGVGIMGKQHIEAYLARGNDVLAIADINEETLKAASKRYGIERTFTDYRELLRVSEIDAVSVCTPPFNACRNNVLRSLFWKACVMRETDGFKF